MITAECVLVNEMNCIETYDLKRLVVLSGNLSLLPMLNHGYGGDMPNVMLYGQPGLGKTTVALAPVNEFLGEARQDDLEINASQDRTLSVVRDYQ